MASAAALLLICSRSAMAGEEPQSLAQMDHTMWTARDGAPQAIMALAQDPDGTLWLGSESGLVNFDGLRFRKFESDDAPFPADAVDSLLAATDGSLWVGFHHAGVARIKASHVTVYSKVGEQPLVMVQHPREARDGSIWAINNRLQLIRIDRDGTCHLETPPVTGSLSGIFIDTANTLWVVQGGSLYRRPLDQSSYSRTNVAVTYAIGFAETPDGRIWISDMNIPAKRGRTQLIDPLGNLVSVLPFTRYPSDVVYAPDASLILAVKSLHGGGVRRFSAEELSGPAGRDPRPDVLTQEQGLSSNATNATLIDSHGNIWIGGQRGLDRLRRRQLTPFDRDNAGAPWVLCGSRAGEMWIANAVNQLYKVSRGTRTLVPGGRDTYSLACLDGDRAWLIDLDGVSAVAAGTITRLPSIAGTRPYTVMRIAAAPDQSVYATVTGTAANGGGAWHFKNGQWKRLPGEGFSVWPQAVPYVDSQSRLWLGYAGGQVRMYADGRAQLLTSWPGLGYAFGFLDTSRGLFAAGNGLAVLRNSQFVPLAFADPTFVNGVRGLVQSRNGDLWLNAATGIVHVPVGELDATLADASHPMKADLISEGEFAGVPQVLDLRSDTAARDADGHLWFATRNGVVSLDPERWQAAIQPPVVTLRSMVADGQRVDERGVLDAGPRTLAIQYQGVNLTAPDNVVYRYQLIGFDEEWQDAGRRTEAIYTRLPPGTYTFKVMASNGDSRWTVPVSSKSFTVLPGFYQTRWFAVAVVSSVLLVLVVGYRLRVRQISRVLSARLDERVAERTRVARELHDTLLQSFQGLMLRFQSARDLLPAHPARAVEALDGALDRADQAIAEGRDAIQNLRSSTSARNELAHALRAIADELTCGPDGQKSAATFDISVEGSPRDLHPIVRDDIHRIACEAFRNAFCHAQADRIEAEVTYGALELRVRIRDDGKGIDPQHLSGGRARHWGLTGMRERAVQIGAQLELWSEVGAGTEVELRVPDSVAYKPSHRPGSVRRLVSDFVRKDSTDER